MDSKKVFISYCWGTEENQQKVLDFASELRSHGVDAILDKWDLKEGHDKYYFMEKIKSNEIDKVLILCDEEYKKKADSRTGGAGDETILITPDVFNDTNQTKYIPIIWDLYDRDNNKDFNSDKVIPNYLQSRIYFNLYGIDNYNKNLEPLLRNIFDKPTNIKPKLGKVPDFVEDSNLNKTELNLINKKYKIKLESNPNLVLSYYNEFRDELINHLRSLEITFSHISSTELAQKIWNKLVDYQSIKLEIVEFFKTIINCNIDINVIVEFFETIIKDVNSNINDISKEILEIIRYEMFMYYLCLLYKSRQFTSIGFLLNHEYLFLDSYKLEPKTFSEIYSYGRYILDFYENNKKVNSPVGFYLKKYCIINFEDLFLIDTILTYFSSVKDQRYDQWFPLTLIYNEYNERWKIFYMKFTSKSYFESHKSIFGFKDILDFQYFLNDYQKGVNNKTIEVLYDRTYPYSRLPLLTSLITNETVATKF